MITPLSGVQTLPLICTRKHRPCKAYHEVIFPEQEAPRLRFIRFENYYTAFISIQQRIVDIPIDVVSTENHDESKVVSPEEKKEEWVTILRNFQLMEYPHSEYQSQGCVTISTSEFNSFWQPQKLTKLRIYVFQPSPCWMKYKLRNLSFFGEEKAPTTSDGSGKMKTRSLGANLLSASYQEKLGIGTHVTQQLAEHIAGLATARMALAEAKKRSTLKEKRNRKDNFENLNQCHWWEGGTQQNVILLSNISLEKM
eukprot:g4153.t1